MWTLFKLLVVVALVALAAAYVTKPDQTRAEAALEEQVLAALAREDIGAGQGDARNIALIGCKMQPQSCYDLVRAGIQADFSDHTFYSRLDISGFGKAARCFGVFGSFTCPGGLKDE